MIRKILAITSTVITLFAIKETFYVLTSNDIEIINRKAQLAIVAVSITLPLILLTLWLWISKTKPNKPNQL